MEQTTPHTSRAAPDPELTAIANYISTPLEDTRGALDAARLCLMDALACACMALHDSECTKLLGPVVPGVAVQNGARVPGTAYVLDPIKAAFDISALVRWQDFSDTWWAGGHPSDNIGAVLATSDYLSRTRAASGKLPLTMRDAFEALTKAYEIHGLLSCGNRLDGPGIGLCSTLLVKIASTAVAAGLLGGSTEEIVNAVSNAFVDNGAINVFRKGRHAGTRKNWAAGDATSRGVQLALMALRGEMGYPSALSAQTWGFNDVVYRGRRFEVPQTFGTHVIQNVQFKISYPAQRHTQTAAECAVRLHPHVASRLSDVEKVVLSTHRLCKEMVTVTGPLPTAAARDHNLQYVTAVGMIYGDITHESYSDSTAADPRIDALREKMIVEEEPRYTQGYDDPAKHSNANAIQVFFRDGSSTDRVEVEYLLGDPKRRKEGLPVMEQKFERALSGVFGAKRKGEIAALLADGVRMERTPVHEFMDLLAL